MSFLQGIPRNCRCTRNLHAGAMATAYVHHHSIRFKMDSKKNIVDLEAFREMKRSDSDTSITPLTATPTPITTVAAAPRLTAATKGKQPARAKSPYDPSEVERTEAEQLKIVFRKSRQETHISQHGGSSTDEGTGSKPGVP
nr:hypothetical protein [Tanacetum cinerariifolium]